MFENDGCTSFLDGWGGLSWRACCDVHDEAFATGHTLKEFIVANYELWKCVAVQDIFAATLVLVATMTVGALFFFFGVKKAKPAGLFNAAQVVYGAFTQETNTMAKGFPELRANDIAFIKVEEGSVSYVYDDAVWPTRQYKRGEPIKGTLTAGVGHTGVDLLGWIGKTIPQDQINRWLDADLDVAERAVHNLVKVPITPNQRSVLVSFTFNAGVGAFTGSTLLKKLNAGHYDAVPLELAKWTRTTINGKKQVSNGLVKRRADEASRWLAEGSTNPAPRPADKPTGTQVAEKAPPTVSIPEVIAGGGAVAGPAAAFANSTGIVAIAFAVVVIVAVTIIAAIIIRRQFFNK